jgi:hypothetical protein
MSKRITYAAFILVFTVPFLGCEKEMEDEALATIEPLADEASALTAGKNYSVAPGRDPKKCLAAATDSIENGTRLKLIDCDNSLGQTWMKVGTNSALSLLGTKCLDLVNGKAENGNPVQLWDCFDKNTAQRWKYTGGQIRWNNQNKCLDLKDGNLAEGATVQLWDCDSKNLNQQWKVMAANPVGITADSTNTTDAEISGNTTNAPVEETKPVSGGLTAQVQEIHNIYSMNTCLDVHDWQTNPFAQTYHCNSTFSQKFNMTAAGQIQFPSQDIDINGTTLAKGTYCLTAANPKSGGASEATLARCVRENTMQLWGQSGAQIVSVGSKLCLNVDPSTPEASALPLTACSNSATQNWAIADSKADYAAYLASVANLTVAQRCQFPVTIVDASNNSVGAQKMFKLYGGKPMLQKAIVAFIQKNCSIMYQKGSQVPDIQRLRIVIDTANSGAAYAAEQQSFSEVHINAKWYEAFNPTDAPLRYKTDAMFRHELAHVLQHGDAGLASGIVEGFANWAVFKAGNLSISEKVKGGSWTDGYSTTAFFLLYLDDTYPPKGDHQGYTWRLNNDVQDMEESGKKWTSQYFIDTTGKSVDTLWADYQKSF